MPDYTTVTITGKKLSWVESSVFDTSTVTHGMFTRFGGVSENEYHSLNVSFGVGDSSLHVKTNRDLLRQALDLPLLVSTRQIHGNLVFVVNTKPASTEIAGYDALITNLPGLGLMIQQADCQAVLLHDPVRQVIAAVHSGWRGSVVNIIEKTISRMQSEFQTKGRYIRAVISPSLGPCCAEFTNHAWELPPSFSRFRVNRDHYNFWELSRNQLRGAGVLDKNIEITKICTKCNLDFFSHRRSSKNGLRTTGRNCSIIALRGK